MPPKIVQGKSPRTISWKQNNDTSSGTASNPSSHPNQLAAFHQHQPSPVGRPPILADALFSMKYFDADEDLPLVYCDNYNIHMLGLEYFHYSDSKKYAKLARRLNEDFLDTPFTHIKPTHNHHSDSNRASSTFRPRRLHFLRPNRMMSGTELKIHHTPAHVDRVHEDKSYVAKVIELWALNLLPMCSIESRLLSPIKWQIAGTVFASYLAMQHGWAFNLGGGFHQACSDAGKNFCLFSDVLLAMKYIWRKRPLQKFMIIDLDAHQAVGIERDLVRLESKRRAMVYMFDMFNTSIQPPDSQADGGIDLRIELNRFTGDETYLNRLASGLAVAFEKFKPSLVFYVAGQDVLKDDPLGLLNLSASGLKKRDEMVFDWATKRVRCPIVMLLGGGYMAHGVEVQADSIRNLFTKDLIWGGHRSGSRSLTRPLMSPSWRKGFMSKQSVASVIDAVSQSMSTSSGARKRHIIPMRPRAGTIGQQMSLSKTSSTVKNKTTVAQPKEKSPKKSPKDQQTDHNKQQ